MSAKIKIGVLGGDMRQSALSVLFADHNIECAVWGIDCTPSDTQKNNIVRSADWRGALGGADAVILPLPLTTDGVRLNCGKNTLKSDMYVPRVTEIIQTIKKTCLVFGGRIPANIKRFAVEHNVRMIDYYEFEDFQIKNAVPTAEGAIAVAIREMDITLAGCRAAVVGYGRIGRTLATRLVALGAGVTCIARSNRDLAWAQCDGCNIQRLDRYRTDPNSFDVIFNTVPHMIFDDTVLSCLPFGQLIIDLASSSGGIDIEAAECRGIRAVKALSLPGKCSPVTAGEIIYDTVKNILNEEGVL